MEESNRPNFQLTQQLHDVLAWDQKGQVPTTPGFDLIRHSFQEEAARVHREGAVRLVNATESGAYIEGFAHEPLAQVLQDLDSASGPARRIAQELERAWLEGSRLPAERLNDGIEQAKRAVTRYASSTEEASNALELLAAIMDRNGVNDPAFDEARVAYKIAERRIRAHNLVELWIEGDLLRLERKQWAAGLPGIFEKARQTLALVIEGCRQVSQLLYDIDQ